MRTIEERFWAKVDKYGDCWTWTAGCTRDGYGAFQIGTFKHSKSIKAHRLSYELHTGEKIPDGLLVCHHCDNPPCVNPEHLFLGTYQDNIIDAVKKGRVTGQKLSENDVRKIRAMRDVDAKIIAAIYGITRQQIYNIRNRKQWKYIT